MLIDEFLPEYDFVETHNVAIHRDAASVYQAMNEVDLRNLYRPVAAPASRDVERRCDNMDPTGIQL